jgi:Domain of unknown function (DUF4432)
VLENDTLRVVVLPGKGGEIWELWHVPSGSQLLWHAPWELRRGPAVAPGSHFDDWYAGGWQDLLPNGDTACEVEGVSHGFHGESWALPWSCTARDGVLELSASLTTLPLRVTKTLSLDGPTLRIEERVENAGAKEVSFSWGHHPALGGDLLDPGCVVDLPGGTVETPAEPVDVTSRLAPGATSAWPYASGRNGERVDLRAVPPPTARTHDVALVRDLVDGWCAVRNPRRRLGLALTFPRDVFRWLWIWQAFGGATAAPFDERVYTLALEPWTSPPSLAAAVARGEAAVLAAGASLDATIEATVLDGAHNFEPPSAAGMPDKKEREDG